MSSAPRSWKLLDILEETSRFFADRHIPDARLQAELLLAAVLDLKRLDLYLQFDRPLDAGEVDRYRDCVRQRLRRVPVQYIVGTAAFRHLELSVTPAVLIPRPETEVLVDVALERLADRSAPRCLDLCCGSGAIALSLAFENERALVAASDISQDALQIARQNAERSGVSQRIEWLCGDLFAPLGDRLFDLIACNPPYVRHGDIATLEPEVHQHEPHLALDGGGDGLDFYRRICSDAGRFLAPAAHIIMEIGHGQADDVVSMLDGTAQYEAVDVIADLNDIPRVIAAQRRVEIAHG